MHKPSRVVLSNFAADLLRSGFRHVQKMRIPKGTLCHFKDSPKWPSCEVKSVYASNVAAIP
eukprot:8223199-Pyramimonas_sp.AAC.1